MASGVHIMTDVCEDTDCACCAYCDTCDARRPTEKMFLDKDELFIYCDKHRANAKG